MPSPSFRLEPLPGYAPTIGRLVGILGYARQTTLAAVEGLSIADLDHLQDGASNSIGALLAHVAARSPLRRNVSIEGVGTAAACLCSDLAAGITAEVLYVDCGYSTVGMSLE